MNKQSWLLNLSLLKTHPAFRAVFLARFISIVSLGLLGVAVPVQIQMMTHSTWQVGLSVTLTGGAMFVGLMVGGVLADRYERKKVILLARGTCGIGFIGLCLNALLPEPSLLAIYLLGLWDGFFAHDWRFIAGDRWRSLELRAGGGGHVYYLATVVKPSGVATATAAA